jgi:hypothetical protein
MAGRYLAQGQEIATVSQNDQLIVHTLMEQKDMEVVTQPVLLTEVRPAGAIDLRLKGGLAREMGKAQKDIPAILLHVNEGGSIQPDPKDPKKSATDEFNIAIPLVNPDARLVLGQRAYVRFTFDKKPLVWQWTRRFLQLIQQKSSSSPWI